MWIICKSLKPKIWGHCVWREEPTPPETTWHLQECNQTQFFQNSQSGGSVPVTSVASSRRQPRQPPWIKDGIAAATEDSEIGRLDLFLWPALSGADIWFYSLVWGVIECWSAEAEHVTRLSIHFLTFRGAQSESTQTWPGGKISSPPRVDKSLALVISTWASIKQITAEFSTSGSESAQM